LLSSLAVCAHCTLQIITDLAVIDVVDGGLVLKELAEGVTVDDVKEATGCSFDVDSDLGSF